MKHRYVETVEPVEFCSPSFGPSVLTENEVAWLEFLRLVGNGRDPAPTLRRVQLLRRVCQKAWPRYRNQRR